RGDDERSEREQQVILCMHHEPPVCTEGYRCGYPHDVMRLTCPDDSRGARASRVQRLQFIERGPGIENTVAQPVTEIIAPLQSARLSRGLVQDRLQIAGRNGRRIPPAAQCCENTAGHATCRRRAGVDAERIAVLAELARGAQVRLVRSEQRLTWSLRGVTQPHRVGANGADGQDLRHGVCPPYAAPGALIGCAATIVRTELPPISC